MQELEKQFPEPPLLPSSPEHRAEVEEVCQRASGALNVVCLASASWHVPNVLGACIHIA